MGITASGVNHKKAKAVREKMQALLEELEKDECYGCAYGKCGPCIGICYKTMKA